MEKVIWVIEEDRTNMRDVQRKINVFGGMRVTCISSEVILQKAIDKYLSEGDSLSTPSLIIINYQMILKSAAMLETFKTNSRLAGVPLFFMVESGEDVNKEEYYLQGAMLVLEKPLNKNMLFRIQQAAAQYEMTKSYERIFQKQVSELAAAKEIHRLNVQLENRNEFLHRVFGRYFSDELLKVIMEKQEGEFIGGNRVPMAVLMADLRGFSSKSETMTLNELMDLLNYFFGTMAEIIAKYNGTIIELMGDGILAVFGALIKNEKYAEAAVASAIEMQNAMQDINEFCRQKNITEVEMGIGIHCGQAFVGNVGSERMMRYNVIGRVVNECSRIEGCSIGGQIFISEQTKKRLSCNVKIESNASVEAKGIREPLQIYEVSEIDGTYACKLQEKNKEPLYDAAQEVIFELFPIYDKVISEKKLIGRLKKINFHDGILEIMEKDAADVLKLDAVTIFSDVEVRIKEALATPKVVGVYAKIIKLEGNQLRLRFTHSNETLKQFVEMITNVTAICTENVTN